jgi:hypothetical protein
MEYEYVINTWDATFGALGGMMELLWAFAAVFVGGYSAFWKEEQFI